MTFHIMIVSLKHKGGNHFSLDCLGTESTQIYDKLPEIVVKQSSLGKT